MEGRQETSREIATLVGRCQRTEMDVVLETNGGSQAN
jgi:hypothetical protein